MTKLAKVLVLRLILLGTNRLMTYATRSTLFFVSVPRLQAMAPAQFLCLSTK